LLSASSAVQVQVSPAPSGGGLGRLDVLLLGVGEAPDFVGLDALGPHAAHRGVMESLAGAARINEQLGDGIQAHARDPRHGTQAVALAEQGEDGGALG